MDTTTIILLTTTLVSSLTAILVSCRKNIKQSSCCGGEIQFRNDTPQPSITIPTPTQTTPKNLTPVSIQVMQI